MVSITMVPPMRPPMFSAADVSRVVLEGRKTWNHSTRRFEMPLEAAMVT